MKFTIDKSALLTALTKVSGVVSRRNTIPILSSILIEATTGAITIKATDLDKEATVTVVAQVAKPGSTCVDADKLMTIAKNAADGAEIVFELGDRLAIKSGRSRFNLAVLAAADFPIFSALTDAVTFEAPDFSVVLNRPAFSVCTDQSFFYITGVHLVSDGKTFASVATDGKRMALFEREEALPQFAVTVPADAVAELVKIDGPVSVSINAAKIRVKTDTVEITAKLISQEYAAFRRVVPKQPPLSLTVDRSALVAILTRAAVAIEDKSSSARLTISTGEVSVRARVTDAEAADECDVEYGGPAVEFGVNTSHLLDALRACGETVEMCFGEDKGPFIVRTWGESEFLAVLIPLRS